MIFQRMSTQSFAVVAIFNTVANGTWDTPCEIALVVLSEEITKTACIQNSL